MGTGYKGGASYHHSLSDNIGSLSRAYPINRGYFGEKGQGRSFTRNIPSDNPSKTAKDFFDKAAFGGKIQDMSNGKGQIVKMHDGTIISYRQITKSDGSSAVEINIKNSKDTAGVKGQKIHFIRE